MHPPPASAGGTCWVKLRVLGGGGGARAVWGPWGARAAVTHTESRLTEQILGRVLLVIRILGEVVDFLAHPSEGSWGDTSRETLRPLCTAGRAARGQHGSSPGAAGAALGSGLPVTPNTALGPRGHFGPQLLLLWRLLASHLATGEKKGSFSALVFFFLPASEAKQNYFAFERLPVSFSFPLAV